MRMILNRNIMIFFFLSFFLLVLNGLCVTYSFGAAGPIPDISINVGNNGDMSNTVRILLFLTVLTFLPAILLMMTSFTRFVIVFSLLRHALGLQQTPPNQVIIGLALFMSFFVMSPVFSQVNTQALKPYMAKNITQAEAFSRGIKPFREFMAGQVREKDLKLFVDMSGVEKPKSIDDLPIKVLVPAFITSELKTAFQIGFVLFIPFLIIDMVVASVLMSMGMMMLPPVLISLPFKLMLFVLVDGWALIAGSMVRSFQI